MRKNFPAQLCSSNVPIQIMELKFGFLQWKWLRNMNPHLQSFCFFPQIYKNLFFCFNFEFNFEMDFISAWHFFKCFFWVTTYWLCLFLFPILMKDSLTFVLKYIINNTVIYDLFIRCHNATKTNYVLKTKTYFLVEEFLATCLRLF